MLKYFSTCEKSGIQSRQRPVLYNRKEFSMKKIICKVEYDTETSALIEKRTFGQFGDANGHEESLYKTEGGKFFLYTFGGPESKYAKEAITRMSAAKAEEWLANK